MIHFFTTDHHRYTIEDFVESWMGQGSELIDIVPYEKWSVFRSFASGVCVFTDLERLLPFEIPMALDLANALLARPKNYTVLNQPGKYCGRFNLLRKLYAAGINSFGAVRFDEDFSALRYPVFIRNETDHKGPITDLLNNRAELDAAAHKLRSSKINLRHLIVIEYCHCAGPDGIFRKYSVLNVAGTLVPRHVLHSDAWATKNPDIVSDTSVAEEKAFLENFPDREQVAEAFRVAGVEYGRIDYGLSDGKIQIWEINTNPVVVPKREKIDQRRIATQTESANQIATVFRRLAEHDEAAPEYPFRGPIFVGHQIELLVSRPYRQFKYGRRA